MWQKEINVVPVKISLPAFNLLEVLISTVLGAFLLLLFSSGYTDFYKMQTKQRELLYLQSEANQLIHYFQQHIQHINFQGSHRVESNFDLFLKDGRSVNIPTPNCFIFFYDLNKDGCLGTRRTKKSACYLNEINNTKETLKEIFGFKLENNEIYSFSGNLDRCIKQECQKLLNDCSGKWTKFSSIYNFKVNKLAFSWKKADQLIQVEMELESITDKYITYKTKSYIFILNHQE